MEGYSRNKLVLGSVLCVVGGFLVLVGTEPMFEPSVVASSNPVPMFLLMGGLGLAVSLAGLIVMITAFMSLRWPKYLPRFPAILLMPAVLTAWALLWVHQDEMGFAWWSDFPLRFVVMDFDTGLDIPGEEVGWSILGVWGFLVDTSLALTAAWAPAMALDRLLFPWIRSRRRRHRAAGEPE